MSHYFIFNKSTSKNIVIGDRAHIHHTKKEPRKRMQNFLEPGVYTQTKVTYIEQGKIDPTSRSGWDGIAHRELGWRTSREVQPHSRLRRSETYHLCLTVNNQKV